LLVHFFTGNWYLLYIGLGIIADRLGWLDTPYPFLSVESDPSYVVGGAVVGLFILQASDSLVLYHLLVGIGDDKSSFTILWGFISLGFDRALLRFTLPTAIQLILENL
jgi:hypothetical protein